MMAMILVFLGHSDVLKVRAVAQVAQFVFGDSLVDQGNNNYLNSIAKANFMPNGIDLTDFNSQPTGRFCNGRIVSDFISDYMGLPPILAYLDPNANGVNLLRGCSFASAGSGILDDTGAIFIQRISLNQQIADFQDVKNKITAQIGQAASDLLISKALFAFTTGGNDYINNYILPGAQRAQQYNVEDYTTLLVNTYEVQLKKIYSLGARKISIANVGPLGCIPDKLQSDSTDGSCVEKFNQLAVGYNNKLKPMLDSLSAQLPGAIITYSDSYYSVNDLISNAATYGFQTVNTACCGAGKYNGLIPCLQITSLCQDRNSYLFWDPFHPTEYANSIVVKRLLFGTAPYISPMNLSQLIPL